MGEKSKEYLSQYVKLTDELEKKIVRHMERYNAGEICAWYEDWEDFCSDWCDGIGYTRTEARNKLHGGIGEFMILPDGNGIIRFDV